MNMRRSILLSPFSGLLALALAVVGCGGGGPQLVTVRGKLLDADGKPVFPGSIWFVAEGAATGAERRALDASSMLYQDGSFRMRTDPHGEGAMVGKYKVTLSLGAGSSPKLAKYAGPRTTTLSVDVTPVGIEDLVFRLDASQTGPPAKFGASRARTGAGQRGR